VVQTCYLGLLVFQFLLDCSLILLVGQLDLLYFFLQPFNLVSIDIIFQSPHCLILLSIFFVEILDLVRHLPDLMIELDHRVMLLNQLLVLFNLLIVHSSVALLAPSVLVHHFLYLFFEVSLSVYAFQSSLLLHFHSG
jgi:hypothetical protein